MSFEQELESFMGAIRQVESGGRYDIMGTDHGSRYGVARGAYQIMSGIWGGWAREAGLAGADWRDPAAQDAVARHKMSYYFRKYGDWRLVAAAWFGGEGAANKLQKQGEKAVAGVADGFGTTVPEYVRRVVSQLDKGVMTASASDVTPAPQQQAAPAAPVTPGQGVSEAAGLSPEREELRQTYGKVLDGMSQIIAGSPDRFQWMYEQQAREPTEVGGVGQSGVR